MNNEINELNHKLYAIYWFNNLSHSKFAKLCGISPSYLSLILSGKRRLTDEVKQKIEKVLEQFEKGEIA